MVRGCPARCRMFSEHPMTGTIRSRSVILYCEDELLLESELLLYCAALGHVMSGLLRCWRLLAEHICQGPSCRGASVGMVHQSVGHSARIEDLAQKYEIGEELGCKLRCT